MQEKQINKMIPSKESKSKNTNSYICEKCKDTGWLTYTTSDGFLETKKCECLIKKENIEYIRQMFNNSKIPIRYKKYQIGELEISKTLQEELSNWDWKKEKNSILLIGGYGTGKTTIAICLLKKQLERGIPGLFETVPDLLDRIRKSYDNNERYTVDNVIELAKKIPLLVLDDMGVEKPSEWVREKLFQIINHRYGEMLPTIFTSNFDLDEIQDKIGERVFWRIIEMSQVFRLTNKNFRI